MRLLAMSNCPYIKQQIYAPGLWRLRPVYRSFGEVIGHRYRRRSVSIAQGSALKDECTVRIRHKEEQGVRKEPQR